MHDFKKNYNNLDWIGLDILKYFQMNGWEGKTPQSSVKVLSKTLESPVEENETLI